MGVKHPHPTPDTGRGGWIHTRCMLNNPGRVKISENMEFQLVDTWTNVQLTYGAHHCKKKVGMQDTSRSITHSKKRSYNQSCGELAMLMLVWDEN